MIAIRLLVLIATLFESGHSQALVDAPQFGKQYFVGNKLSSLDDSRAYCLRHHGELVRVDSIEEERFVRKVLQDRYGGYEVGVNAEKVKGRYVWPNGDVVRISRWKTGYPQCTAMYCRLIMGASEGQENSGWRDWSSDGMVYFVCEIRLEAITEAPLLVQNPNLRFRNWTVSEIENLKADNVAMGRMINRQAQDSERRSKYFLTDEAYNSTAAKEFCESHNGHLAVVGGKWEEVLIGVVARDTKPWIGLENVNGTFKWLDKYELEYTNWNSEATLYTLEELLRMQSDFTPDMNAQERIAQLSHISEQFARYREKWGEEIVECQAVYMESDRTWNVDRCSATRYGICEKKTWTDSKSAKSTSEMKNEIAELKSRLEKEESQKRETQQQIAQLFAEVNEMKKKIATND